MTKRKSRKYDFTSGETYFDWIERGRSGGRGGAAASRRWRETSSRRGGGRPDLLPPPRPAYVLRARAPAPAEAFTGRAAGGGEETAELGDAVVISSISCGPRRVPAPVQ